MAEKAQKSTSFQPSNRSACLVSGVTFIGIMALCYRVISNRQGRRHSTT